MDRRIWEVLFRLFGAVNIVLSVAGFYEQSLFAVRILSRYTPVPAAPYFLTAFYTQVILNFIFAGLLLAIGTQLFRLRLSAVAKYAALVIISVSYTFLGGMMWLLPNGVGTSIAAATGVGNMAMACFDFWFLVPFFYPAISVLGLLFLRWRLNTLPARDTAV